MKRKLAAAAALFVLVTAVFWTRLPREFVHWDDDVLIVANPHLSLAPRDVAWMFTTGYEYTYQPLGWLLYGALDAAAGKDAHAYHAAGLLLHAANGGLLLLLLAALTCPLPAAAVAAAAWTLHPLTVDSFGWATELPDLLATAFYLLALLAYASRRKDGLRLCLAFFVASGLTRWKGVNLPIALVLLDLGPLRRGWKLREKLPIFAVSVLVVLVHARLKAGLPSLDPLGSLRHPLGALWALSFYLTKAAFPVGLASFYLLDAPGQPVALGAAATVAIAGALFAVRRRRPEWLGAWLCYATAILPTCGASAGGSVVAMDHYAYLALIPFSYPLALAAARLKPRVLAACAAPVLAVFLALSRGQLAVWRDTITLWTHALDVDPASCPATSNLGETLYEQGRVAEAQELFRRELEVCPDNEVTRHHAALLRRAP